MVKVPSGCVPTSWGLRMVEACTIRRLSESDLPMVLGWRNHPEIRRYMFTQHEIQLEEHHQWFARANLDPTRCLLLVEEASQPLGYVQFSHVAEQGVSDWGFYVRPNAPSGTGKKLGVMALNHAFEVLRLHKVCGQAIEANTPSIRFHERLGFTKEGELRDHQCINGQYHTLICYGLLARDWHPTRVR